MRLNRKSVTRVALELAAARTLIRQAVTVAQTEDELRAAKRGAEEVRQALLQERNDRNSDIRGLNRTVRQQDERMGSYRRSLETANAERRKHHDSRLETFDKIAWTLGALRTVRDLLGSATAPVGLGGPADLVAVLQAREALLSISKSLREQLDERMIPIVPMSSLGGGGAEVARANRNFDPVLPSPGHALADWDPYAPHTPHG